MAADYTDGQTPSAPFVTETPSWTKLGLKVALKEAVKEGADKIAWTTGEQQNDRYDLSKVIDKLQYNKNEDVTCAVYSYKDGKTINENRSHTLKPLKILMVKKLQKK